MKSLKYLFFFFGIFLSQSVFSQDQDNIIEERNEEKLEEKEDEDKLFHFNLQLKNMHLWRGYHVTNSPVTAADVNYTSKNGFFKAGLWGGRSFTGEYTEYDYYVSFMHKGFTLAVWDINNNSDYPDVGFFNYDRAETSHFIDVSLSYSFKKTPLKVSWATIVQGRDTYVDDNGELKNAFSNYVEASYIILDKEDWSLAGFVGGAFSFLSDANFYGDHSTINNVGVIYNRDLKILEYTLPVSATASWNPLQEYGAIQVAVNLF
ncbi:hypothetical protein [Mesonia sp.]|uniref:hypothetical protein n=1 Tax=Mesonia sp. TaxID=1960830 RepID=UPI0017735C32|nr:hypothetical protein [Mesonia sp.]HIB36610.1 hypothetical protein [Mesonia sp.]HIO27950.1 hypothetical protein [Flavobacteriaceae bacterium]